MASAGRPRRVLIVVQNLPVPFDRRVWLEATTLARAGYRVSVICPKAKGFTRSFEVLEGVHIHRYRLPVDAKGPLGFVAEFLWCFLRTAMKSLRVAMAGRGFDVLHVCNPPGTYWPLARFWQRLGKRFLFDHHDLSPEMYQAKFGASGGPALAGLRYLERKTFQAADLVVTTNQSHRRVAVE
ncbi:MAG TPA: glycosyltransferase, partial [Actinomycetota bacterium]